MNLKIVSVFGYRNWKYLTNPEFCFLLRSAKVCEPEEYPPQINKNVALQRTTNQSKHVSKLGCSEENCSDDAQIGIFELDALFCSKHSKEILSKHRDWHSYDFASGN